MKGWRAGLLITLVLVFLAACSFTGVVYNRADWLVYREVSKYLPLTDDQSTALRAAVLDWQVWHRQTALPQWASDARALAAALQQPLSEPEVMAWGLKIEAHVLEALDQTLVRLVPLMASLDDTQIDAFWASFDKAREERREERGVDADSIFDRASTTLRRWVGRPDAPQRALIRDWAERRALRWTEGAAAQAAAEEAQRREQIHRLLAQRTESDAVDQWRLFLGTKASPRDRKAASVDEQALAVLLADLTGTLSDRQRERLSSRLHRYAAQFGNLSEP